MVSTPLPGQKGIETVTLPVTSTVILRRVLELLGADVVHFIPERLKDGYGLQPAAVERLRALSPLWEMHQDGIDLASIQWTPH